MNRGTTLIPYVFLFFILCPNFLLSQCEVGDPKILNGDTGILCGNAIEVAVDEATIQGFVKPSYKWRAATSAIGAVIFGTDNALKTTVAGIASGTINIFLEVTETAENGSCGTISSSTLSIAIGTTISTPTIIPGFATICSGDELNLIGISSGNTTQSWSVEPAVPDAFSASNEASTTFTAPMVDRTKIYKIFYKASNGPCADSAKIFVRINPALVASIDNGANIEVCLAGEIELAGGASGGSNNYTHSWTKIGGAGVETISTLLGGNENIRNPIFKTPSTAIIGTTYALRYTLTDEIGCTPSTADVLITVTNGNAPIAVDQTNTQCSDAESEFTLKVTEGSEPAAFWDLMSIDTADGLFARKWNSVASTLITPEGLSEDAYINDGMNPLQATYRVIPISAVGCRGNPISVTFEVSPQPIAIAVEKDGSLCSNTPTDIHLMTVPSGVSAANWEILSIDIPDGVIAGANNAARHVQLLADAISEDSYLNQTANPLTVDYLLRPYSAEGCNGQILPVAVEISTESLPIVNAGVDQVNNCGLITILDATSNIPINTIGSWSILSDNNATGIISELNDPKSQFIGAANETYELEWRVTSSVCNGFSRDEVNIGFDADASLEDVVVDVNNNPIPSGTYQASLRLNSMGIIEAETEVTFRALSEINLNPGFHAKVGSDFLAKIEGCMPIETLRPSSIEIPIRSIVPNNETSSMKVSPNPFSDVAVIKIDLPYDEIVSIGIFNQTGHLIKLLSEQQAFSAGKHAISFTREALPPGIFFIRMMTKQNQIVKKVILLN